MKANRAHARLEGDTSGVSTVMGGILFLAVLSVFLVTIRVEYVPIWEEEREARHIEKVQGQLSTIKSEMDRQAGNRTGNAIAHALALGDRGGSRYFTAPSLPATLTFFAGASPVEVSTSTFRVFEQNGRTTFGSDETWQAISGETIITGIGDVRHLRLRLDQPSLAEAGDYLQINVSDADGAFAGQLRAYIVEDPPDKFIAVRSTDADGDIPYDQGVSFHQVGVIDAYWINALDDEKQFRDILLAADAPLTLDFVEVGMTGNYTIAYTDTSGGGLTGTSGRNLTDYSKTMAGGRLEATYDNLYFESQTYTMEGGGIVLSQGAANVMRVEPALTASVSGSRTNLGLTVPVLTGASDTVSAVGTATITADGQTSTRLAGSAPHWNITVDTDHPAAWTTAWSDILDRAGLDAGAGEYTTSTTATEARLTVYGKTTAPGSTEHDINVEFTYGSIDIRMST